jgi:hypothetical protein
MKAIISMLTIGLCLITVPISADSIRVGGVLHKNVYIISKPQHYFVHFPEEGRVEKISRARRDVEAPMIDSDASAREALRARYEARRAEKDSALEAVPEEAVELDTEAFLQKEALVEGAIFESQFEHWRGLSEVQQDGILREILNLSASKEAKWAGEQSTIQSRLSGLDAAKAERETDLAVAQSKRDATIEDAKRDSAAGIFMEEYEKSILRRQMGNSNYIHEHWLEAAETEVEIESRRMRAANEAYGKEADAHKAVIDEVESAITQQERDAQAVENKGKDAARRYGAYLDRIDGLILASQAGYEPGLKFNVLETWQSDGDKKTPTVLIESSLWRLHCEREDFGLDGDFAITVYDAETDTPFTRIADKDFLKMRSRIFERQGKYYFVVEQDSDRIPYELTVSAVAEE